MDDLHRTVIVERHLDRVGYPGAELGDVEPGDAHPGVSRVDLAGDVAALSRIQVRPPTGEPGWAGGELAEVAVVAADVARLHRGIQQDVAVGADPDLRGHGPIGAERELVRQRNMP